MATSGEGSKSEKKRRAVTADQLRTRARRMTDLALTTLGALMEGEGQTAVRLSAAREILDRGYGRPRLKEAEPAPEGGFLVEVKRFTDPPEPKAQATDEGEG